MAFNLRRAKQPKRPIDILRSKCPELRLSDLELEDEDIANLAKAFDDELVKEAVHGRGDNWTEVGPHDQGNYEWINISYLAGKNLSSWLSLEGVIGPGNTILREKKDVFFC